MNIGVLLVLWVCPIACIATCLSGFINLLRAEVEPQSTESENIHVESNLDNATEEITNNINENSDENINENSDDGLPRYNELYK